MAVKQLTKPCGDAVHGRENAVHEGIRRAGAGGDADAFRTAEQLWGDGIGRGDEFGARTLCGGDLAKAEGVRAVR